MQFQKGEVHNPRGRPQGSYGGRRLALANLDKLLAREENQTTIMAAIQAELDRDPFGFFKSIVMPLTPKESKIALEDDGIVEWKSLVEAFPLDEGHAAPEEDDPTQGGG